MKAFIISPVRTVSKWAQKGIYKHVELLEKKGYTVHLPIRDTNQQSDGLSICQQNMKAIQEADLVCIWYCPNSVGSVFDLGVTMSLNKPLRALNYIERTEGKSFANVVSDYASQFKNLEIL